MKKNNIFLLIFGLAFATQIAVARDLRAHDYYTVRAGLAGGLNCRIGPGVEYHVSQNFWGGELVYGRFSDYDTNERPWFYTQQGCYVRASSRYLTGPVFRDFYNPGDYCIKGTISDHHLNCRYGPGLEYGIKKSYWEYECIETLRLEYSNNNEVWHFTQDGCFIRANSRFMYIDDSDILR